MLIWNKSDELRNGSPGIYVGKHGSDIVVEYAMVEEKVGEKVGEKGEAW